MRHYKNDFSHWWDPYLPVGSITHAGLEDKVYHINFHTQITEFLLHTSNPTLVAVIIAGILHLLQHVHQILKVIILITNSQTYYKLQLNRSSVSSSKKKNHELTSEVKLIL